MKLKHLKSTLVLLRYSVVCNSITRYTRRRSKSQLGCAMRIAASGSKAIVPFQVHDYGAVVSNGLKPAKNRFTCCDFTKNFNLFSSDLNNSVSGDCICLTFKLCHTIAHVQFSGFFNNFVRACSYLKDKINM